MFRILIADDEAIIRNVLSRELQALNYTVDSASDGQEALGKILNQSTTYDLVILDNQMPKLQGLEVLRQIRMNRKDTKVIMLTAFGTISSAVEAMKLGAFDYMTKPFENDELLEKINRALLPNRAAEEGAFSPETKLVYNSPAMANIIGSIVQIRDLPSTVLILGESGTGKGMIARIIHNTGAHAEKPFIHVNCAALPANLIDSELFGHTKGAFTGAAKEKKGKFEAAEGGTIFLDEISTLSLDLQAKLLHVLQERSYEKIGSNIPQKLKCRVITATNSNLAEDVQAGKFRKDLYYRLNVVNIHCPPLRQRKEDIELLMSHFFDRYNRQYHRAVSISLPYTWELILAYNWPGNVRELENFIERIVAMNISDEKNIQDILLSFGNFNEHNMDADPSSESAQVHDIADLLRNQEYRIIINALNKNNGHRERTAQELGISRRTLQYKLKKYNINKPLPEV